LLALAEELGEARDGEFAIDAKLIDWKKYFGKTHLAGLERYAINEYAKNSLVKTVRPTEKAKAKTLEPAE